MGRRVVIYLIQIIVLIFSSSSLSLVLDFETKSGEIIAVHEHKADNNDNLFINIVSYRGLSPEFEELLPKIALAGLNVWTIDLVNAYMLAPIPGSFDKIPSSDVSEIINEARIRGYKNIYLYSISKSSNFALKVAHDYQSNFGGTALKGHIMHVPELWITSAKTSKTKVNDVAKTSNLPIYLIMTEFGTKYHLTQKITDILQTGGSPVFVHKLKGVRSGFHVRPKSHLTEFDLKNKEDLPSLYRVASMLLRTTNYPPLKGKNYLSQPTREYSNNLVKISPPKASPKTVLPTFSGALLDLELFRGKKVLINFWASWCKSCATEIPSMNRLKDALGDELEIITINIGENKDLIREFKDEVEFDFPIMMDINGEAMRNWGVFVYPTNFILNQKGDIIYTYTGSLEWDNDGIIDIISSH